MKARRKWVPERDPPPTRRTRAHDWLSLETGHVLEWSQITCGGRHCAALSKTGHVFTWGSDDVGQLGHGRLVAQRLPCLLWLQRDVGTTTFPVDDVRQLGCGHRYSAALTWRGECFVWGQLGKANWRVPTAVEGLSSMVVVHLCATAARPAPVQPSSRPPPPHSAVRAPVRASGLGAPPPLPPPSHAHACAVGRAGRAGRSTCRF